MNKMTNIKHELNDTVKKVEDVANKFSNDTKHVVEDTVHDMKSNVDSFVSRMDMKREDMMEMYEQKKFSKNMEKQMKNHK